MVERYVHQVLNQHIGKYLEGFNRDNLKISIFKGDVKLQDVKVKSDVFQQFGLPFEVKFGKIKQLNLSIPWSKIFSASIVLVLESLMVVVSPLNSSQWKPKDIQSFEQQLTLIQDLAQMLLTNLMTALKKGSEGTAQGQAEDGMVSKAVTKIADNIQITIKNIHIRYEVDFPEAEIPQYVVGFTLKQLNMHSTNSKWEKIYVDRTEKVNKYKPMHNVLQIEGLAIYLQHQKIEEAKKLLKEKINFHQIQELGKIEREFSLLNTLDHESIQLQMSTLFPPEAQKIEGVPYFIEPVFLNLQLTRLMKFELDRPNIQVDLQLQELNISLSRKQYEVIFQIAEYFKQFAKIYEKVNQSKKYNYLRPIYPIGYHSQAAFISLQSKILNVQSLVNSLKVAKKQDLNMSSGYMSAMMKIVEQQAVNQPEGFEEDNESPKSIRKKQIRERFRFAFECVKRDNRFKRGCWTEFKITNWRKKEYARHFINIAQKCITDQYHLQFQDLSKDDKLLLQHILAANETADIQNWLGIVLKRKIHQNQAVEEAKQQRNQRAGFMGKIFGWGASEPEEPVQSNKDDEYNANLSQEELDQIEVLLTQVMATEDSISEGRQFEMIGLTELQKQKQIKFRANLNFGHGRINLLNQDHKVQLYQDDLQVVFDLFRDTSFKMGIVNKSVGVNVIDLQSNNEKQLIVKHIIPQHHQEEEIKGQEIVQQRNNEQQWSLSVEKKGTLETGFITDIQFQSNPIKLKYDAEAFSQLTKFFQTGSNNEELRDQALNKITVLRETTRSQLKDLLYKQKNHIHIKIASPIMELPFKAHNSGFIGESEADRDRIWLVNLGNLDFKNVVPNFNAQMDKMDQYERFLLQIDSIGLNYIKKQQCFKVLEDVKIGLDIKIKNQIKAAILAGNEEEVKGEDRIHLFSPEVLVDANLPEIIINCTPDVYNGLVNLNKVLSSEGQDEQLKQLKLEKDHIVLNSQYINEGIQTRGLRGQLSSNWLSTFTLISGSYIYFYKSRRDLMPIHYIYISDCKISSNQDVKDAAIFGNAQQIANLENVLLLKNQTNHERVYLRFNDKKDSDYFMGVMLKAQQDLKGEVNILRQQDIVSELIHKDQREVGFKMTLVVQRVEGRIWESTEKAILDQRNGRFDQLWLKLDIDEFTFALVKMQYEIKLGFTLSQLSINEGIKIKQPILVNEPGQKLVTIDIDVFDLYSPNLKDSEIILKVELCKLYLMFDPVTINNIFKFFRNTKTYLISDMESLNVKLMDQSEQLIDQVIQKNIVLGGQLVKQQSVHIIETCKSVNLILVKVIVKAEGLTLIAVHNLYHTPVFELSVGSAEFEHLMFYDHDVIRGDFSNARLYDLTSYPLTIDPSKQSKACLSDFFDQVDSEFVPQNRNIKKQEVIGIRDEQGANQKNGISFESILYGEKCPVCKPGKTSSLSLDIETVKIIYFFEMSFRIIDYFFDKFLWAITESDPYAKIDAQGMMVYDQIKIEQMSVDQINAIDMKQEKSTMDIRVKIKQPYLLIKDRPYFDRTLQVDLGELTIEFDERDIKDRFKLAPEKSLIQSLFIIDCKDVSIKYSEDNFVVAAPFDLKIVFSHLIRTDLLHMIDSSQLDKSYDITIDFDPQLNLRFREDIYTFLLRCVDLNFAYSDNLDEKFQFAVEPEYFRSSNYIVKSKTTIRTQYLALSLFTKEGDKLTEIGAKNANIVIDYYLNRRHNYLINVEEISSYFFHQTQQNLILFGNKSQIHAVDSLDDIKSCICDQYFVEPSQIVVKIEMHPDGKKNFNVELGGIKLFVYPYFYFMINHFFTESLPTYDLNSVDKPNEYSEDFEQSPEMNMTFKLTDSLICFANSKQLGREGAAHGIACQANLEYQFKREKIKSVKAKLFEKVAPNMQQNNGQDEQLPFSWMALIIKDLSPYICDLSLLQVKDFNKIQKRQLINPFNLMFHFGRFMKFRVKEKKIFIYERSETKKDKMQMKISFKDTQLVKMLMDQMHESYTKFSSFQKAYMASKKDGKTHGRQEQIFLRNTVDISGSFIQKTQNAMKMIRTMQLPGGATGNLQDNSGKNSNSSVSPASQVMQQNRQMQQLDYTQMNVNQRKDAFMNQIIDYDGECEMSSTKVQSEGISIVIINDSNNVFYPVLTVSLQNFAYKLIQEFGHENGHASLKMMLSYYNAAVSEWEPFIEKTQIEYIFKDFKGQAFKLISCKNNLNINFTTQLLQILSRSQNELKALMNSIDTKEPPEEDKKLELNQAIQRQQRGVKEYSLMRMSVKEEEKSAVDRSTGSQEIEYKVTPYTIINYSSRTITVRRVYQPNDNKIKEYQILPGQKADYEVDYEEEVKHLTKHMNEDVVRKQDFLNVMFDQKGCYAIKDINLRNPNFYIHQLFEKQSMDFVVYGVKVEDMRKILIIRSRFVFNNLTDVMYKVRFVDSDKKLIIKTVNLQPGDAYPIDMSELDLKCQLSNDSNGDDWSSLIRVRTIAEKIQKNATAYLYHGNQFTIIRKEKSEHASCFNINFKTPVIIKNALPCNLKIRTDIIVGKILQEIPGSKPREIYEYEKKDFMVERGRQIKLHNFNLESLVEFMFNFDTEVSHVSEENNLDVTRQSLSLRQSEVTQSNGMFQWAKFQATNSEFKIEKQFTVRDSNNQNCGPLTVFASMRKCQEAGLHITFYVKNVVINNTDQRLQFLYIFNNTWCPAAGQLKSQDNSIILLPDTSKIRVCLEDEKKERMYSDSFTIDVAGVINTIKIQSKNQIALRDFTVKTELSRACDINDIYTMVTTISPCYVLHNKTKKTIIIKQEECDDQYQILLSGARQPFFWKDSRKPRLVRIMSVERDGAEFDDDSHEWTFPFSLHEIGRVSIINRHKRSFTKSKHFLIDKQLQEDNQILFITFLEETAQFATYKIENRSKSVSIEYHQKDYPHNTSILSPQQNQIFSWTNPQNTDHKVTCKFFGQSQSSHKVQIDPRTARIDIEPDNLELNTRFELPPHLLQRNASKFLYIYTITNGFSKILVFSDISQAEEQRKKEIAQSEELKEGDEIPVNTLRIEIISIGISMITQTYQQRRKEFAFLYFEDIKFVVLEAERKRETQLRIGYFQIDNNVSVKPLFQVVMYPKELYMKRDKAIENKAEDGTQQQEAFKEFFNMHITRRMDDPEVMFIEEIDFLVQTLALQVDDEFIGYLYRFTDTLDTPILSVHDVFKSKQSPPTLTSQESSGSLLNESFDLPQQKFNPNIQNSEMMPDEESKERTNYPNGLLDQMSQMNEEVLEFQLKSNKNQEERKNTTTTEKVSNSRDTMMNSNAYSQQSSQSWLNYEIQNKAKKLYIKSYRSSPIDIELSYVTKIKTEKDELEQANKKFSVKDKVKNYGLNLVNLERISIRINSLALVNIFGTSDEIIFQLKNHYMSRLKQNILGVFGQTFLGSPANFINHLGTGVQDFFYMPISGMIQGPLEGGKGILRGTTSLLQNTVQGTMGSASKVFSQVSKGLLLITSDGDFINKREKNAIQDRPSNVMEGVGYGLKSIFKGVKSGITGVVNKPIQGAQNDGVKGFMKGMYKGLSGLVVKPVSGTLDFVSKTTEGIKNNVSSKEKKVKRIRMIRPFYGHMQLIKGYNQLHSEIVYNMNKIEKGRYAALNFLDAILYNEAGERRQKVIILTEEYFIVMDPAHRDIQTMIKSMSVMTAIQKNLVIDVHIVDQKEDLKVGYRMILQNEKEVQRNFKIMQNYIYHIRTEIMAKNPKQA